MAIKGVTSVKDIASIFGGADTAKKVRKVKPRADTFQRCPIQQTKESLQAVCHRSW